MRNIHQAPSDLERWRKETERIMRTRLPRAAGAIAVAGIKANFRQEAYTIGATWQARKGNTPRNKGRKLLIDTGALRRSIRHSNGDGVVTVYTDVPYAPVHNEGHQVTGTATIKAHTRRGKKGSVTVKQHTRRINFKMPKRQFMPIPGEPLPTAWRKQIDDTATDMFKKNDAAFRP